MDRRSFVSSVAGAAVACGVPRIASAAAPSVKIGYLDSFSGPLASFASYHRVGVRLAVEDANRRGRTKFVVVEGDDASTPAQGGTEARRLIAQENVDVMLHGTNSASVFSAAPIALEAGRFFMTIGAQDTAITGKRAQRNVYRFVPTLQMIVNALGHRILASGKKWYFVQADYAVGKDAYARLSDLLKRAGGTEVGLDVLPLGNADFSSTVTKIRNSGADQVVLCNTGIDVVNFAKQFVSFGLHKRMKLAGFQISDYLVRDAFPVDELAGSVWGVLWTPDVSDSAEKLRRMLAPRVGGYVSERHYLAYVATRSFLERIESTGSTDAERLVGAFADHHFDAAKRLPAIWRACDHQAAQDSYAAAVLSRADARKKGYPLSVVSEVPRDVATPPCNEGDAATAAGIIRSQKIPART